jgi:peptide deformylase
MSKMKIVTVPSKILREKSKKIEKIDKKISRLIKDMLETMHEVGGLGISAPQIGKSLRLAIIESKGGKRKNGDSLPKIPLTVLINPEVLWCSDKQEKSDEGCLSVPNIWGEVERPESIRIKTLDENGKTSEIKASGLFARVIQHEMDHLEGIIFTDKADYKTLHKLGPNGEKIPLEL